MGQKEIAAEAIDSALTHAHKLEASREARYLIADLETARDELKRPRTGKARPTSAPSRGDGQTA